jgi:hypothetical protein
MKYKLHYAKLKLEGDIPCLEYTSGKSRMGAIMDRVCTKPKVFLLNISNTNGDDIATFVFEHYWEILFLEKDNLKNYPIMYLQEYNSYEAAYKAALEMKEPNPLCYER